VSSRHNDDRYLLGPFRYVDRLFARRAHAVIAISDAVKDFLEQAGLPREKLVTVRYGLDAIPGTPSEQSPAEVGITRAAPLLLAIGRLIAQKDHATMIEAFARTHIEHPDAMLVILGDGPLQDETQAHINRLGLEGAVLLPGRLGIRDWLKRADIFVHTSRWEGFGLVLLEAMLAELPIVATRVSAVPEVVDDGVTGILVTPGDVVGVADSLTRLLNEPTRARALGRAGLERARSDFSIARMAEATIAVYATTLPPR
jgi:glycosyltransferase involved in cell wall biosynthesis